MAWTRIDDKFLNNIKIRKAGALGMALYLAGLIHCNTNLTDGFIDDAALPLLYGLSFQNAEDENAKKLVKVGLWHKVSGGYEVNDFLDFNRSKDQIANIKAKRAESGSKGGNASRPNAPAKPEQNGEQIAKQIAKPLVSINTLIPNTLIPKELKQPPPLLSTHEELVGSIFKVYEHEIGMITQTVADDIKSAVEDYPLDWFEEAFKEAARNNKRNWRYALAILKRWKVEGFKVDSRTKQGNNGHKPRKPLSAGLDEILAGAPIFAEDK